MYKQTSKQTNNVVQEETGLPEVVYLGNFRYFVASMEHKRVVFQPPTKIEKAFSWSLQPPFFLKLINK